MSSARSPSASRSLAERLHARKHEFSQEAFAALQKDLGAARAIRRWSAASLRRYHDALLFIAAYPGTPELHRLAEAGLRALPAQVRALSRERGTGVLGNSGLPGTSLTGAFSLGLTRWLVDAHSADVAFVGIDTDKARAMAMLGTALDPVEREVLSEEAIGWPAWLDRYAGRSPRARLAGIVRLAEQLPASAAAREAAFASLGVYARWRLGATAPSLALGRLAKRPVFTHQGGLVRSASPHAAMGEGSPEPVLLDTSERETLVALARGVLCTLFRETDPVTFANAGETELFDVGRGVQIALFYMLPERKLALESYVGYLLLKNHVPVAYGGGWVLGHQCRFGVNVLPPFRGGESAHMLAQLLRLYAHRFRIRLFVVEPYQIGHGNPDGIRSGAFWFYYRQGFRPLQPVLAKLADTEFGAVTRQRGHRTSAAALKRLAESVLVWETRLFRKWDYIDVGLLGARVTEYVNREYGGDRHAARVAALERLGVRRRASDHPLAEWAVLIDALGGLGRRGSIDAAALIELAHLKREREGDYALRLQDHPWLRTLRRAGTPHGPIRHHVT